MNCKPGDLAVIVRSVAGNEGRIVRCVRLNTFYKGLTRPDGVMDYGPVWEIDRDLPNHQGWSSNFALDSQLRPIRDPGDDAKDEMLRPLPHKEVA